MRSICLLRTLSVVIIATAIGVSGCDLTGQYEAEFQKALSTSAQKAVFDEKLYAAQTEVIDAARKNVGVQLRIWKFFDADSKSLPPTDPRAQPPFVKIPDLSYAIERQLNDDSQQFLPTYLYIAAVPKKDQKPEALQASLAQQVAAAFPAAKWEDAQLRTPTGGTVTVKRLRASGQQQFMNIQKNTPVKIDGTFDLYLINGPEHYVLLGWRAPKPQSDKYQFGLASETAMGTVLVNGSPPPPLPAAAPTKS